MKFDTDNESIAALHNEQITPNTFLANILLDNYNDDRGFNTGIKSSLLAFHQGDGGSPVITKFDVESCSFDPKTSAGKVRLAYEISFTFGCADIHRTDKFAETCKFEIDINEEKLLLYITDHITRDTVEEF